MKNIIILGSGRSGTSLMASMLAGSGYFMGNNLVEADEANPLGYFEDYSINKINEDIIESVVPRRKVGIIGDLFFSNRTLYWQRWLSILPLAVDYRVSDDCLAKIKEYSSYNGYCYKDPRFCYTLPVWKPYLNNVKFICVFRKPGETAVSLVKEAKRDSESRGVKLKFDINTAYELWMAMYTHVMANEINKDEWCFVEYENMCREEFIRYLCGFCNISSNLLSCNFRSDLKRSKWSGDIPEAAKTIYQKLSLLEKHCWNN